VRKVKIKVNGQTARLGGKKWNLPYRELALWKQGIVEDELPILLESSERDAMSRSYDGIWSRWKEFCRQRQKNPRRYDVGLAVRFLGSLEDQSLSYLRQARSALSVT